MTVYERMAQDENYCLGQIGNIVYCAHNFINDALKSFSKGSLSELSEDQRKEVMMGVVMSAKNFIESECQED